MSCMCKHNDDFMMVHPQAFPDCPEALKDYPVIWWCRLNCGFYMNFNPLNFAHRKKFLYPDPDTNEQIIYDYWSYAVEVAYTRGPKEVKSIKLSPPDGSRM